MRLVRRKSRSRMTRWPNRVPRMALGSMTTPSPIERFNRCHRSDDGAAKRAPCKKCLRANWRTCVSWARLNRILISVRSKVSSMSNAPSKLPPPAGTIFSPSGLFHLNNCELRFLGTKSRCLEARQRSSFKGIHVFSSGHRFPPWVVSGRITSTHTKCVARGNYFECNIRRSSRFDCKCRAQ
jgi:hypothetical protein